jgi:hypothetical protein
MQVQSVASKYMARTFATLLTLRSPTACFERPSLVATRAVADFFRRHFVFESRSRSCPSISILCTRSALKRYLLQRVSLTMSLEYACVCLPEPINDLGNDH